VFREEAVVRLAEELDGAQRREALRRALEPLRGLVEAGSAAAELGALLADDDLVWRWFAAAHLAGRDC
jgi:hypothetical protein